MEKSKKISHMLFSPFHPPSKTNPVGKECFDLFPKIQWRRNVSTKCVVIVCYISSLELFTICSYPSRLAFNSTKANLAFSLMYLFYPLATFANHFFISFSLIFPKTNCCLEYFLLSFQITIWTLFFYIY